MVDFTAVRAVALDANFTAHGLDSTRIVTPDGTEYPGVRIIWLTFENESTPGGSVFTRREPIRVVGIRKSDLATVPKGTRITAPETFGAEDSVWIVDSRERTEAQHHRVVVRRESEPCDA